MKIKYILSFGIVILLAVIVVAQSSGGGLRGEQGNLTLNKTIAPKQMYGNCLIEYPIVKVIKISGESLRDKRLNYTGEFHFAGGCVQGFAGVNGTEINVDYSGSDNRTAVINSIRAEYQKGLNKGKIKKNPRDIIKGRFTG